MRPICGSPNDARQPYQQVVAIPRSCGRDPSEQAVAINPERANTRQVDQMTGLFAVGQVPGTGLGERTRAAIDEVAGSANGLPGRIHPFGLLVFAV